MKTMELHDRAMELADIADILNKQNQKEEAIIQYREAFMLDKQAALMAYSSNLGEPTISVLLRSAASLAINCKKNREAEKLITLALSGEPPFEIAEELRDLLENVNFYRHLEIKGEILCDDEVQLVIAGKEVGYGMAKTAEIMSRIDTFNNIAQRTVERHLNRPFRKSGPAPKEIRMLDYSYVSAPQAASMAFRIKFGAPNVRELSGLGRYNDIISDITENIELINENKIDEVRERIKDTSYFDHFISYVRELAPNGDAVNLFGITSMRNGEVHKTLLTESKDKIAEVVQKQYIVEIKPQNQQEVIQTISGTLRVADANKNTIEIISGTQDMVKLVVPDGLSDIVRKYWDDTVSVTYSVKGRKKKLITIN